MSGAGWQMDGERALARVAAAHFGLAAAIQFVELVQMVGTAPPLYAISNLWPQMLVVMVCGTLAGLFARGVRRPRWAALAFALLWSAMLIWSGQTLRSTVQLLRDHVNTLAISDAALARMMAIVVARAASFSAAAIVALTGRPGRRRAAIGAALVLASALLSVWDHFYRSSPHP